MKKLVAFDCEVYRNFFLAYFKDANGKTYRAIRFNDRYYEGDKDIIRAILKRQTLITFNGQSYDLPVLAAYLLGWSNRHIKALSDDIIQKQLPPWELSKHHPTLVIPTSDQIDLIGATPLQASLKTYGCRIHCHTLQDLPIHPDTELTAKQAEIITTYCENDLDTTWQVFNAVKPDIALRSAMGREYGQDFRSKSGPQIAEAVIKTRMIEAGHTVTKRTSQVKPFYYNMPDFIRFSTPTLQALAHTVRNAQFQVNATGYVELPDELNQAIEFEGAKYQLGIGGLHSQEKHQAIKARPNEFLGEFDVASMYPSIILGQNLYPEHLGPEFCDIYRDIYDTRIKAKHSGNKIVSDSLKLVLNSSYGKFGNRYSPLYSPELLIQVTLTGQLALLMLIERMNEIGQVVSANTDGIVVLFDQKLWNVAKDIADQWTQDTTYTLEWTPYKAIYSESVNSYIALKEQGGAKCKGTYAPGGIGKGYACQICTTAVCEYLEHNTPIDQTIYDCKDIRQFLTMRGVRGGAIWRGQELGKVVRWYVSTDGEPITYIKNGNKVAGSDNAKPLMTITDTMPDDINYQWYIDKAKKILKKVGL